MKKEIRVYMLHPFCKDVTSFLTYLQISDLQNEFEFVWDERDADYLIATEHIYINKEINKHFKLLKKNKQILIFYAGEAVSPDFNIFDYAIGFDACLQNMDRFCRLQSPNLFFNGFLTKSENDIHSLKDAYKELQNKKNFANFLYSNGNAHPIRDELFWTLSRYKRVDSLGKWLNNMRKMGTGYEGHAADCIAIKRPYKFSIACENACFEGYTSEKILTSLEAHTIPIYWGDPLIEESINPKTFINCNKFDNIEDVIMQVKLIDENDDLWCEMISQPWQTDEQKLRWKQRNEEYISFFRNIFQQSLSIAKRRPVGTWNTNYQAIYWNRAMPRQNSILRKINREWKKIKMFFREKVAQG